MIETPRFGLAVSFLAGTLPWMLAIAATGALRVALVEHWATLAHAVVSLACATAILVLGIRHIARLRDERLVPLPAADGGRLPLLSAALAVKAALLVELASLIVAAATSSGQTTLVLQALIVAWSALSFSGVGLLALIGFGSERVLRRLAVPLLGGSLLVAEAGVVVIAGVDVLALLGTGGWRSVNDADPSAPAFGLAVVVVSALIAIPGGVLWLTSRAMARHVLSERPAPIALPAGRGAPAEPSPAPAP